MSTSNTPRERGILFSAPMVRALLAGTKTQTRRAVKPQPVSGQGMVNAAYCGHPNLWLRDGHCDITDPTKEWRCPFGQVGDRLYVRETFYCDNAFYPDGVGVSARWRDVGGERVAIPVEEQRAEMLEAMYYRADGEPEWEGAESPTVWRPSLHMPRWASRITLEITGVRVERLQDISEDDAIAEGIRRPEDIRDVDVWDGVERDYFNHLNQPVEQYRRLWKSINGPGSWDANPWVWCVEFQVLGTTTTSKEPT